VPRLSHFRSLSLAVALTVVAVVPVTLEAPASAAPSDGMPAIVSQPSASALRSYMATEQADRSQ
jgi:hypothetical protein